MTAPRQPDLSLASLQDELPSSSSLPDGPDPAPQTQHGTTTESDRVRQVLRVKTDDDLAQALRLVEQSDTWNKDEADAALEGLLMKGDHHRHATKILAALIASQTEARVDFQDRLRNKTANTIQSCLALGEDGVRWLTDTILSNQSWSNKLSQSEAIDLTVQQCLELLRSSQGDRQSELLLHSLVRLVSTNVVRAPIALDTGAVETLLQMLDIRHPQTIQTQALLVLMRLTEPSSAQQMTLLKDLLVRKGSSGLRSNEIVAFSAAAAIFPVMPSMCKELLLDPSIQTQVLSSMKSSVGLVSEDINETLKLREAALLLLSASCIDKECRAIIKKDGSTILSGLAKDHDSRCAILSVLIIAKSGISAPDPKTMDMLARTVLDDHANRAIALESFAYLSLSSTVKDYIINSKALLGQIRNELQATGDTVFSCLTVLANLSSFRVKQNKEQDKLAQLRAYAEATKLQPDDKLENDTAVQKRCQSLVDSDVVPAVIAYCRKQQNPTVLGLAVRILFSMSSLSKERARMVQQGSIGSLLRIREICGRTQLQSAAVLAAQTIARLLISVNPALALTGATTPAAAIGALLTLLTPVTEDGQRDWLPTFESLLALTNLASVDDDAVRKLIVANAWSSIENDLLLCDNKLVQRASVELICNLMQTTATVAKFVDKSQAGDRRLHILLVLTDVDDKSTRRGAGGALAMLTGWQGIPEKILRQAKGMSLLLKLATDEDADSRHRGLVCIMNLVNAPAETGEQVVDAIKKLDGKHMLSKSLATSDPELSAMTREVIEQIT